MDTLNPFDPTLFDLIRFVRALEQMYADFLKRAQTPAHFRAAEHMRGTLDRMRARMVEASRTQGERRRVVGAQGRMRSRSRKRAF